MDGSLTGCTVHVPAERFDLPAGTSPVPWKVGSFFLNEGPGGKPYYRVSSEVMKDHLEHDRTDYSYILDWDAADLATFERSGTAAGRARVVRRAKPALGHNEDDVAEQQLSGAERQYTMYYAQRATLRL